MKLRSIATFQPEELLKPEFVSQVGKSIDSSPLFQALVDELLQAKNVQFHALEAHDHVPTNEEIDKWVNDCLAITEEKKA